MPWGYLVGTAITAAMVALTVFSPQRPWILARAAFAVASAMNELPALFAFLLVGSTVLTVVDGDAWNPVSIAAYVLALLSLVGMGFIVFRGVRAKDEVARALDDGLGDGWLSRLGEPAQHRWNTRTSLARLILIPFVTRRRGVRRIWNIAYGNHQDQRLDLLVGTRHRSTGPVLVYLHGGGYFSGSKTFGAQSLLYRLASQGWVCISADYRLRPRAGFAEHLIDAKRVIAWAHEHVAEYGGSPDQVFTSGSSAGAHLVTICGLSEGRSSLQPGFEGADTSSRGVIGLSGYYGYYYGTSPSDHPISSPLGLEANDDTPPMFIAHGELDSYTPAAAARALAGRLRAASSAPVIYLELEGGQHNFDLFRSPRFEAVSDGIDAFTDTVLSGATRDLRRP